MSSSTDQLPGGWQEATLAEVGSLYSGQSPRSSEVNRARNGEPYVTGPEQWDGNQVVLNKWTTDPKVLVPPGCIFITVKGAGVGKIFPGVRCAIGRDVSAYKPEGSIPAGFIQLALRHSVEEVKRSAVGDIPGLSRHHILGHKIGIPPLNEQRRIVSKIETFRAHSERARVALGAIPPLLDKFRQSVLASAFRGDLTADWRAQNPDVEPASALLERILVERQRRWEEAELAKMKAKGKVPKSDKWKSKYKKPVGPNVDELPNLPPGWCWTTIDQISVVGTGATPKRKDPRYWNGGTIPWVSSSAVNMSVVSEPTGLVTDQALNETNLAIYPRGTLLMAMYGEGKTRGKVSFLGIEATTNQALAAIQPCVPDKAFAEWIAFALQNSYREIRSLAEGGAQPNLNLTKVRSIPVPLSPPTEVAEAIERMTAYATSRLGKELSSLEDRLANLDAAILSSAFQGKLVPQDPNDEPASELLARIRAVRATAKKEEPRRRRGKRGSRSKKPPESAMLNRSDVNPDHLSKILEERGPLSAEALWNASQLEIDEFYEQLKEEEAQGLLRERRGKGRDAERVLERAA